MSVDFGAYRPSLHLACQVGFPSTNLVLVVDSFSGVELNRFSDAAVHAADSNGKYLCVTDGCGYSFPEVVKWDVSKDDPVIERADNLWGGGCSWQEGPLQLELSADNSLMYLASSRAGCSVNDDRNLPVFFTDTFTRAGQFNNPNFCNNAFIQRRMKKN